MSNKKASLKSGIRDNLLRETVHDFLQQEIKNGSALSIVSAYFTIYAYEKMQHALNKIEGLRFLFGDPDFHPYTVRLDKQSDVLSNLLV